MLPSSEISRFLRQCPFLAEADDSTLEALAGLAVPVRLLAGEILFAHGQPGTAMYLVVEGEIRVHRGDDLIVRLERGELLGEIAALSSAPRTASATAERDSALLKLEQDSIFATLAARPGASRAVIQALCRRETQIIDEKYERIVRAKVLENELEIGQRIQKSFLPEVIPAIDGWRFDALLRPARKVAGDFYDFFPVPALGAVCLVIGDVCDKGVGAALFMSLFRSLIRSATQSRGAAATQASPAALAETAQHAIASTNRYIASTHAASSMFASVFFGLVAIESGRLCYVNAGHEAPWIIGAAGRRKALETTGPVVGLFDDAAFGVAWAEIAPGEHLFGYTDGASDAHNGAGQAFSEDRLLAAVQAAAPGRAGLLSEVDAQVRGFVGDADIYDDVTMISVQREGLS
ncbi:MAG: SpoIIE family protein phosphatase [Rubrivivax sp.]|nr:SpoIIE family protein phosphatase [Rubrivivax sp.]